MKEQNLSKKILVVLTGGTIGSKIGENEINVNPKAAYSLIHLYQERYEKDTEFEVIQPMNVLSENMTPKQWNTLIQALDQIDFSKYQGVVITHGSDTLAYSSALLGLRYGHVGTTIAVIAANYALEDERSNGMHNFRGAISFIKKEKLPGVYTFYQDNKGIVQVYLATRLVEADCYADQFSAFGGVSFGKMVGDGFVRNDVAYNPTASQVRSLVLENVWKEEPLPEVDFSENVLLIHSYPGMNYDFIQWENGEDANNSNPKAVLISLYHSATSCVSEDGNGAYSLATFAKRCQKAGIAVYASSFKSIDMKFYASIHAYLESGVKPLCNISTEAAYAKLMLGYDINENYFFEMLPEQG